MKHSILLIATILPGILFAQNTEPKKDVERIIITKKGTDDKKINIEIDGKNILVNGKPIEEKNDNADITVKRFKIKDMNNFNWTPETGFGDKNEFSFGPIQTIVPNKAMLGITTEQSEQGVKVVRVAEESAAEKAGFKIDDIIIAIDSKKIEAPDKLSEALKSKNPGDKINVTYSRNGKTNTINVELTKWDTPEALTFGNVSSGFSSPEVDINELMSGIPRNFEDGNNNFQFHNFSNVNGPKLGIKIQDITNGDGVKIIEVEKSSDADKAGLKEGDIINEANNVIIKNADDILSETRKNNDKTSMKLKINRNGRTENIEVLFSKKIKTAEL